MISLTGIKEIPEERFEAYKSMAINCGRTINRFIRTMTTLSKKPNESIAAASADAAEAKAIYRLLNNPKLTEEVVMTSYRKDTLSRIQASEETIILSVQDTTECNYTSHKKTKDLGDGTHKNTLGLFVHSNLALTPDGIALGLLDQSIWARDPEQRGKRKTNRPIEEKESNKWLQSMEASAHNFPRNIRLVHMGDREADLFEFLYKAQELNQFYVIRAVQNRITDDGQRLFDRIKQEPAAAQVQVDIPRDTRRSLKSREATLEIRYLQMKIQVPQHLRQSYGDGEIECTIVHAYEIHPLEGVEPIEWFLITNLAVTTVAEAMEKVRWYVHRWKIERFHYILKSGCEIEELQEREAERLKKLILMYSIIAIEILSITYLARETPDAPCETLFEKQEWQVLYRIANRTSELPTAVPSIKEAVSYLAKLGGFLGRKGDGDPGVKVIWKGLKELQIVIQHYKYLL
ncbi:MAG: IS4 family transposase [Gorillibacterium sp.]|nr:IS4 family transposase [Gorillibacterium sp.]